MTEATYKQKPRIFAHRGTCLMAPENTQAAFDFALRYQADVLETDVRLSKDGMVMVTHDESLQRTTNGSGLVRDYTASELKQFDAAHGFTDLYNEPYTGDRVSMLTLNELFELYPTVGINIDIKDNDPLAAMLVADVINRYDRSHNTTVGSFHSQVVLRFRQIAPNIPTAATRGEVARLYFSRSAMAHQRHYRAIQIPVSWKLIPLGTTRFIQQVQSGGTEVCFWTINKPRRIRQLLALGADGIVTDRVDLAKAIFRERETLTTDT